MIASPWLSHFVILVLAGYPEHGRVSLDEKIRCSDAIVIGSVENIGSETRVFNAADPATSAKRVATLRVDKLIKGLENATHLQVGFQTEYEGESDGAVNALALSPDGSQLIAGGSDGWCKSWNLETRQESWSAVEVGTITSIAFRPDSSIIALGYNIGYQDGGVALHDAQTGSLMKRWIRGRPVEDIAFTLDGRRLIISERGSVRVQDLDSEQESSISIGQPWSSPAMAVTPDSRELITVDTRISFWDIATQQKTKEYEETGEYARALAISPTGRLMSVAYKRKHAESIRIRSLQDKDDAGVTIDEPNNQPMYYGQRVAAFSPDERWLATGGGKDNSIRIWDVANGQEVHKCIVHQDMPTDLLWTSDGKTLISSSRDGTIRSWDVGERREKSPMRPRSLLAEDKQYVLFLRKTAAPYYSCVNWNHGALEVVNGDVEHPERPANDVARVYRDNLEYGPYESEFALSYNWRIPLDEAERVMRSAVRLTQYQHYLGDISLGEEPAQVFWEKGLFDDRVVLRLMNRLACDPPNLSMLRTELADGEATVIETDATINGQPPSSVDPLGAMMEIILGYQRSSKASSPTRLAIIYQGNKTEFDIVPAKVQRDTSVESRKDCPNCRSRKTVRISYGLFGFVSDACQRSRMDLWRAGGCMMRDNDHHCRTCGLDWDSSPPCERLGPVD